MTLANLSASLIQILEIAVLLRVLYSWIDPSPYPTNTVKRVLWSVTEPILAPLRRVIPPLGMFDISPIVAIVLLQVVQRVVLQAFGAGGY
jgi:YggT family protein